MIRLAQERDIPDILAIFEAAKIFMAKKGNLNQWTSEYPGLASVQEDLTQQALYVLEDNQEILAVFSLILEPESSYQRIEGSWRSSQAYGSIHRLASNGQAKGVSKRCFDFCKEQIPYLRIDTHEDNIPMQAALTRYGFVHCGTIYLEDGSPRLAFDYLAHS